MSKVTQLRSDRARIQTEAVFQVLAPGVYFPLNCLRLLLQPGYVQLKEDSRAPLEKAQVKFEGEDFQLGRTGNGEAQSQTVMTKKFRNINRFFRERLQFLVAYEFSIEHVNISMRWCVFLLLFCPSQFFRCRKTRFSGSGYGQKYPTEEPGKMDAVGSHSTG